MEDELFKHKVLVTESLLAFGFDKTEDGYHYRESILDGQFDVLVQVATTGELKADVIDVDMGEPYTAFRATTVTGRFVGQVREAYVALLENIVSSCYIDKHFQSEQANRIARRLETTFSDVPDFPFEKSPEIASFRVPVNRKWYALLFPLNRQKLDASEEDEVVDVLNIKVSSDVYMDLLDKEGIYPSYHMSKKNWMSIILDDRLSDELIWDLVVTSRQLVAPKGYQVEGEPDYWIIPANPKYYDIAAEFAASQEILWTQKAAMKKGDIVAIYMTAPERCLRYCCQVIESDLTNDGYRDRANIKTLMRLRLLVTFEDKDFSKERLAELGITTVRGPRRVTKDLYIALKSSLVDKGIKEVNHD